MSESRHDDRSTLNRRQMLRLSTTAGVAAALPGAALASQGARAVAPRSSAGNCSTPRTAVASTRYGKVRGYVEDGVLTF
jgi:para-nitrobenzyl esterase